MPLTKNEGSTLAAMLVGDVISASHFRDEDGRTWLHIRYADGRSVWMAPDDKRIRFTETPGVE